LITAGVAVALQRVITSFAAYLIILRGKIFNVGDRITIGGVRGDVIALDFMQTTVMEIGETPGEQGDAPSVWITARQYTGRMIRVTNDKIFDSPVYNFTRVFPYLWEEMQLPISYKDNRREAERILLEVGHKHTDDVVREAKPHIEKLVKEFRLASTPEIEPHVYMRLTDNWVNFSMRFLVPIDGGRKIKDGISRDLIDRLDAAGIGIASGTYEIVGMPKLEVQVENRA
jgi:small-conductance mechanosensitive channel